jgi:hypothetical protein
MKTQAVKDLPARLSACPLGHSFIARKTESFPGRVALNVTAKACVKVRAWTVLLTALLAALAPPGVKVQPSVVPDSKSHAPQKACPVPPEQPNLRAARLLQVFAHWVPLHAALAFGSLHGMQLGPHLSTLALSKHAIGVTPAHEWEPGLHENVHEGHDAVAFMGGVLQQVVVPHC